MTLARSLAFNALFYLWTTAVALALLLPLVLPRRVTVRGQTLWAEGILRLMAWVAAIEVEIRGREHVPDRPVIIAAKHHSAWDTLIWHVIAHDPAIIMKQELLWIPLYGWYCRKSGMIPIDRRGGAGALKRLLAKAERAVREGRPIVIFPEGTRSAVGRRQAYLPGVAALYLKLGVPVVPVAVNSGLFWPRRSFFRRPGTIVLAYQPVIEPGLDRETFMTVLAERIENATDALVAEAGVGDEPVAPTEKSLERRA